ncbi:VOC family protein [Burkholderia perseverans]|uniref:VOC family protein n=1 Tax=Burkholderia perseverans TaxID=2615214 RepID=UPI001FEFBC78|nr:VOC family protein [Burkholderia perseverans]
MKQFVFAVSVVLALVSGVEAQAAGVKAFGVDHVGISVPDLAQAESFFSDTFGCVPVTHIGPFDLTKMSGGFAPRADSVDIVMIRCGTGSNIELFQYRNSKGSNEMPKAEDIGASHIAFYTDDINGAVAYLKSRGITVLGEPITMPSGDTEGETWVHFRSPWGSELELVSYPNGKGYEKHAKVRLWNPTQPTK